MSRCWSPDPPAAGLSSRAAATESVLIAESRWPLSSPSWSTDGRSLAFGRFVPASDDADQTLVHGRYEVVVQSGLDHKKVIVAVPELSLEADHLAAITHLKPVISPDGRYLAVPRPGKSSGVVIVRLDSGTAVKTIDGAQNPSWAPDGLRLLFVLESRDSDGRITRTLHVLNRDMGSARQVPSDLTLLDARPIWALDGQSILAVAQPPPALGRNFQLHVALHCISLGAGPVRPMITLETMARMLQPNHLGGRLLPPRGEIRATPPPSVVRSALSLDRDQEECIAMIEISGQPQALRWCNIRNQRVAKLLNPLDLQIPIGAPAISPDGQSVAFRAEAPGMLGLPAVCDLDTEAITLIAPDEPPRRLWLEVLAARSAEILKSLLEPKVGRRPVAPQRSDGATIDPRVSVPMLNPTRPAAVAEPDPAEEPLDPSARFHGLRVTPPYQMSP